MLKATRAQIDAAIRLGLDGNKLARMSRAEVANWIIERIREVCNAIKTDEGRVATDTNVGYKRPLPVKRDERGPVREKTLKELLAKCDEERNEWLEQIFNSFALGMIPSRAPVDDKEAEHIADEWADMLTATVTLMDAIGIDADERAAAIARCNRRNADRGRL